MLVIVLLSTGASTMIYEVVLIREFTVTLGSSFYSSAIVLSSVMLGLSIGSYTFGKLSDRFNPIKILFVLELAIAILSIFVIPLARKTENLEWEIALITSFLIPLIPAILMGGEIPAAVRIASTFRGVGEASGICYSLDTLGGIFGSLISGFVLIPMLGSLNTVLIAGALNSVGAIAVLTLNYEFNLRMEMKQVIALILVISCLTISILSSELIEFRTQIEIYEGFYLIDLAQTKYQTIAIAYNPVLGKCLFLDGSLQISDIGDEPYSESLVLPALVTILLHRKPVDVLVIGGGDLGVVEVLTRFPREFVKNVTLVELDSKVVEFSKKYLKEIHRDCWRDERIKIVIKDCRMFLRDAVRDGRKFDLVIVDLPDPKDDLSATMYSLEFYDTIYDALSDDGIMVTQATSADYALGYNSYAIIAKTLGKSKFKVVRPYIKYVPSFGMWGFVIASKRYDPLKLNKSEITSIIRGVEVHTYDADVHYAMFALPPWLKRAIETADVNTVDKPILQMFT